MIKPRLWRSSGTWAMIDLSAKLGFLLGAFSKSIESEIEKNLDALLAAGSKPAAKKKVAKK